MNMIEDFENTEQNDFTEKDKKSSSALFKMSRWSVFAIITIAASLTIFYIFNVNKVNGLLYEIRQMEKQKKSLNISNELLGTKIADLESAERITGIARKKLGMERPQTPPEIIREK